MSSDEKNYPAITQSISAYVGEIRAMEADAMAGFSQLAKAGTREGALSKRTKELAATAIAVALRCDGCIGFHAKALVELGVTREELGELLALSIYMGGGPSLMYAADALRAYDQFCAAR